MVEVDGQSPGCIVNMQPTVQMQEMLLIGSSPLLHMCFCLQHTKRINTKRTTNIGATGAFRNVLVDVEVFYKSHALYSYAFVPDVLQVAGLCINIPLTRLL